MSDYTLGWFLDQQSGVEGHGGSYSFWCPCHDDEGTEWKGASLTAPSDDPETTLDKCLCKCHSCGAKLPDMVAASNGYDADEDWEQPRVVMRPRKKEKVPQLHVVGSKPGKGMQWWVEKTQVEESVWESMGCIPHGTGVAFVFEDFDVLKIRKSEKEIVWQGTKATEAPPLWPVPEDEMEEHIHLVEGESDAGTHRAAGFHAYAITKGAKGALPQGTFEALRSRGVTEVTLVGDADDEGDAFRIRESSAAVSAGLSVNVTVLQEIRDPITGPKDLNGIWRTVGGSKQDYISLIERCTHRVSQRFPGLRVVDLEEMAMEDIPWILPGLIAPSDKVLLSGPMKSYKTYVALDLARSLVDCLPFLQRREWTPKEPSSVLFCEEEGSTHAWARRVRRLNLQNKDRFFTFFREGVKFTDSSTIDEVIVFCRENEIDVIFFDPLQRMIPGVDENDASATGVIWDEVARIQKALPGVVVVVLAHANKSETLTWTSTRGSSRHGGEVDVGFFIDKHALEEHTVRINIDGRDIENLLGTSETFEGKVTISDDPPNLTINANEVVVNANPVQALGRKNKDSVLTAIQAGATTLQQVCSETDMSEVTARRHLKKLLEDGDIVEEDHGKGKAKTYKVVE